MILYVMRHAEAVAQSETLPDEWRYLTEKGRAAAGKMRGRIVKYGPKPRLILTSPLVRAVQTAEILVEKGCRKRELIVSQLLLPGGDSAAVAEYLARCGDAGRIMLVGHEPQLGALVAELLGRADARVALKKGSCTALEVDLEKNRPARFLWYLAPGAKRVRSLARALPQKQP